MKKTEYFVNPVLLAEIDHKRDILINRVNDGNGLLKDMLDAATLDASYHSKITEPDHATRSKRIGRRRDYRETRGNLEDAREFADSNFSGTITKDFLQGLIKKIDPRVSSFYRLENAIISGYGDIAVSPGKIDEEMASLMSIASDQLLHPVNRAVLFHLHCLRIHPFTDGNGRISRFVQNMLLAENKYAPAILPPAERTFYNDLIHDARRNFRERGSEGMRAPELMTVPPLPRDPEAKFLHYMATKVNVGMDNLIQDYEDTPHYEIMLSKVRDVGEVMRIKKIVHNSLSRGGLNIPANVRVTDPKHGRIEIRAKIEDGFLARLLDKSTNKPYKIIRFN